MTLTNIRHAREYLPFIASSPLPPRWLSRTRCVVDFETAEDRQLRHASLKAGHGGLAENGARLGELQHDQVRQLLQVNESGVRKMAAERQTVQTREAGQVSEPLIRQGVATYRESFETI